MAGILNKINQPEDLKKLTGNELTRLAAEIRQEIIKVVNLNGGHLASSLGTVELTIALHRVFQTPRDKIVWDVGHQSYTHKILTGRRERFASLRQYGGLCGFPAPWESPHDAFVAGHSGNSISAALGMVLARDLASANYQVISVIGDGSLGSGMAFEAINHAGHLGKKIIVVLNDNGMSISPSVGALARLLNRIRCDPRYAQTKNRFISAINLLPFRDTAWKISRWIKRRIARVILPNVFWEELGFTYLGPLNGHDIAAIEAGLIRARDQDTKPVLVHVVTRKGKGCPEAESDVVKYHGVSPNGTVKVCTPAYSQVFNQTILQLMRENPKVTAITAAMLDGTGLAQAAKEFPDRVFDVGICEQHAVTLAAGMASQGFRPVVAIYSTFLQRGYDQIIHDVCLPHLPVIFAIDRAGIVGEDGRTHQGLFDISFLRCIPNLIVASPSDGNELRSLLTSALNYNSPVAIRYPRGNGPLLERPSDLFTVQAGTGELLRQGNALSLLSIGPAAAAALQAAEMRPRSGLRVPS
jgi:1-deoxy-D-xylulose-5-phosphate synthase